MNLSSTWTSRVPAREGTTSGQKLSRTSPASSQVSLRLVQKTSGLFDTDKAGNETVAGKASKPGLDLLEMDPALLLGHDLEDLFEKPNGELESAYLDSFLDLSNFLNNEEVEAGETGELGLEVEDMTEKFTDFSDLPTLFNPELTEQAAVVVAASSMSPRKRKACEAFETNTSVTDKTVTGRSVYDHDYVSKKLKASVEEDVKPVPSTSKTSGSEKSKYRERRDKNNVASRRSRQIRKQKYHEMDQEAERLMVANEELRKKIDELENLAKVMKAELIKKMTSK